MSLFCLVHGSTQDASGWDLLVPELARLGHGAVRPTLPADEPEASGTRYAQAIAAALAGAREPAIIVAHSASGLYLPLVPALCAASRLVFLAAAMPKVGTSALQQLQAEPGMMCADWIGKDPTKDDAVAMRFLFQDCAPEVARWALTTRRLMYARRALTEICPLDRWPDVPASYILCREDRTLNPAWWRGAVREWLGIAPIELPGGHCPHVSRPGRLAEVLSALASTDANG